MPQLNQAALKESVNVYIQELASQDFVQKSEHKVEGEQRHQLVLDAVRQLMINGRKIPKEYHHVDKIRDYIIKQLGEEHGQALLNCYSQTPGYSLSVALTQVCMDSNAFDYCLSSNRTLRDTNIYVKDDKLCYEVKVNKFVLMNNQVLAGQGSCLSVYDKNEKEFVTQSMSVSNKVLKDMLIKNKFDPKTDLEAAAKEEAEIASARREARSFAENIVAARDILGLQKPKGYGTAPHPMTTLGGTLGKIQSNLDTYLLQNHDPRDFFAEQKQLCHQAIKKAASSIRFIAGKRLLNAVASVLKFKPPFEKLQELDTLKKNIVSTAPSISSRVIR